MKSLEQLKFDDVINLEIPSEILVKGLRRSTTYSLFLKSTGAGMGENPDYVQLVLSDGSVYLWGKWEEVNHPKLISKHPPESGGF